MAFRNPLIEYVKAAFTWRWNLLTFGAGVALSILSPATSVILPLVLAAEISYLALLTSMPRFRKSVDARGLGIAPPVNDALLMKQIKAALKPEAWMRFEYLRDRCIQLGGLAKQFRGPDSVQDLTVTDLQTGSLERLLWMFLKLLYSQDALTRFIKGTDRNDLGRQVAATEKSLSDAKSRERGQEHRHAEVAAVVEQGQKAAVQPAERADAEDDVQHQERRGAERADEQRLDGHVRIDERASDGEDRDVATEQQCEDGVVPPLLRVPADGAVGDAHDDAPRGSSAPGAARGTVATTDPCAMR